jgi:hypothetical protein
MPTIVIRLWEPGDDDATVTELRGVVEVVGESGPSAFASEAELLRILRRAAGGTPGSQSSPPRSEGIAKRRLHDE